MLGRVVLTQSINPSPRLPAVEKAAANKLELTLDHSPQKSILRHLLVQ